MASNDDLLKGRRRHKQKPASALSTPPKTRVQKGVEPKHKRKANEQVYLHKARIPRELTPEEREARSKQMKEYWDKVRAGEITRKVKPLTPKQKEARAQKMREYWDKVRAGEITRKKPTRSPHQLTPEQRRERSRKATEYWEKVKRGEIKRNKPLVMGREMTPEEREAKSQKMKQYWERVRRGEVERTARANVNPVKRAITEEERKSRSQAMKEYWERVKQGKEERTTKGKKLTHQEKRKRSEIMKQYWEDVEAGIRERTKKPSSEWKKHVLTEKDLEYNHLRKVYKQQLDILKDKGYDVEGIEGDVVPRSKVGHDITEQDIARVREAIDKAEDRAIPPEFQDEPWTPDYTEEQLLWAQTVVDNFEETLNQIEGAMGDVRNGVYKHMVREGVDRVRRAFENGKATLESNLAEYYLVPLAQAIEDTLEQTTLTTEKMYQEFFRPEVTMILSTNLMKYGARVPQVTLDDDTVLGDDEDTQEREYKYRRHYMNFEGKQKKGSKRKS